MTKFVRFERSGSIGFGFIESAEVIQILDGDPLTGGAATGDTISMSDIRLLAPVAQPRIFGIGYNYHQAVKDAGVPIPERPLVFMKPSTAAIGPNDNIVYPKGSTNVVFEGELAVVIGRKGRRIPRSEALNYVSGYTCGNDLTERTLQMAEVKAGSMAVSKGFDTFAPLGPCLVTDLDPANITIVSRINGEVRQNGHTSDLVFDIPTLISYLSDAMTLLPGDVIMTGTPPGFGPIHPNDEVEIEIRGIGTLRNRVVAE